MKGVESDGKKRRKWTAKAKMEIVLAGLRGNISEVCRNYGIAQTQYYQWREAFLQGGQNAVATVVNTKEQELEKELEVAKKLIGVHTDRNFAKKDPLGWKGNKRQLVQHLVKEGDPISQIAKAISRSHAYDLLNKKSVQPRRLNDESALQEKIQK